jgi:hypothetical protein
MHRRRYAPAEVHGRITITEVAELLGVSVQRTEHLLRIHGAWIGDGRRVKAKGQRSAKITYSTTVVDKLRGLLGQDYRQLAPPDDDWLTKYQESEDARN